MRVTAELIIDKCDIKESQCGHYCDLLDPIGINQMLCPLGRSAGMEVREASSLERSSSILGDQWETSGEPTVANSDHWWSDLSDL